MAKNRQNIAVALVLAIGLIALIVVPYWRAASVASEDQRRVKVAASLLLQDALSRGRLTLACLCSPAGSALSSWRFAVVYAGIREMENEDKYGRPAIDKEWNAKENAVLRESNVPYFIDPTRPGHKTRFAAITGPGTAFDNKCPCRIEFVRLPVPKPVTMMQNPALLFVEIRNCQKHWMEPGGDLDIRTMDHTVGRGTGNDPSGVYPDGFWVVFADGQCWHLSKDTPFDELAKFFTLASATKYDRRKTLGKYVLRQVSASESLVPKSVIPQTCF